MTPKRFVINLVLLLAVSLNDLLSFAQTSQPQRRSASDTDAIAALNLNLLALENVKEAAKQNDMQAVQHAYLTYRQKISTARWRNMPPAKPATAQAQTDPIGDEVCNHTIRHRCIFEPKSANMGKDFNWSFNPVPKDSPAYTEEWTWGAVARMPFWNDLAKAYTKTNNEKYAAEWVAQLEDFARKNPVYGYRTPEQSSLWRSLDQSVRLTDSWPNCYYRFLHSPSFTPSANWTYLKLILDHASRLKAALELPDRTGNWVTSECYALYSIGALFPELREAEAWRAYAINRLTKELDFMVLPDGFQAELSPSYHAFSIDGFVGPLILARLNGYPMPDRFVETIRAMHHALVLTMDQSGANVCTNDSTPVNARSLAGKGLRILGDSDPLLTWAYSNGRQGEAPPLSVDMPYSGFYVMRSGWNLNDVFLFFRGGPTGISHQHEDMLQIVLRAGNRTLLFDPGNYNYDHSEWRRYILNTPSHNTIIVDDKWQHRGSSNAPITDQLKNPWVTSPLFDYVEATYDGGYQQNVYDPGRQYLPHNWVGEADRSVAHTRQVLFLKPYYVLVVDTLNGSGRHTFDAHFHLDAPAARMDNSTQAVFGQGDGAQLAVFPLDHHHLAAQIIQGQTNPLLGWYPGENESQHRAIPTVRFRKEQEAPARFANLLYPFNSKEPSVSYESIKTGDPHVLGQRIVTPLEKLDLLIADDQKIHEFRLEDMDASDGAVQAKMMMSRRLKPDTESWFGGWDVISIKSSKINIQMPTPSSIVWQLHGADVLSIFNANSEARQIKVSKPFEKTFDLPSRKWAVVTASGISFVNDLNIPFPPSAMMSSGLPYADYLAHYQNINNTKAPRLTIEAETMALPHGVVTRTKNNARDKAITGWDETGSVITARLQVPVSGLYRMKLRYCAAGNPIRTVLIDGQIPFTEAGAVELASTVGDPPSDGWSNMTNDWKTIILGKTESSAGWFFYLPKGEVTISLRNDGGGGSNLDWIELEPQ